PSAEDAGRRAEDGSGATTAGGAEVEATAAEAATLPTSDLRPPPSAAAVPVVERRDERLHHRDGAVERAGVAPALERMRLGDVPVGHERRLVGEHRQR